MVTKTILYIEDNKQNAFALLAFFENIFKDIRLVIRNDGKKGLQYLEEHPEVDMVITDLKLPGLDGYSVIKTIRSYDKWRSLPILVLSAKAFHSDRTKSLRVGADYYLSKPVDINKLIQTITFWKNSLEHKEIAPYSTALL